MIAAVYLAGTMWSSGRSTPWCLKAGRCPKPCAPSAWRSSR